MDKTLWHKCPPPFRSIFGKLPGPDGSFDLRESGQLWRRRVNGKWQYKQDEPSAEDFAERVW